MEMTQIRQTDIKGFILKNNALNSNTKDGMHRNLDFYFRCIFSTNSEVGRE